MNSSSCSDEWSLYPKAPRMPAQNGENARRGCACRFCTIRPLTEPIRFEERANPLGFYSSILSLDPVGGELRYIIATAKTKRNNPPYIAKRPAIW
jgi:hypothetical protein